MCTNERKLLVVPVAKLKPNGFNPKPRTMRSQKFLELREFIARHGMYAPIVIARDFTIIDGHRRAAVAIDLGWAEVTCVMISAGAQEAWAEMVQTTLGMDGRQVLAATAQGMAPEFLRPVAQKRAKLLRAIAGDDYYQELAAQGVSVGVVGVVTRLRNYLEWPASEDNLLLHWLLEHKMQRPVIDMMKRDKYKEHGTTLALAQAIRSNRPAGIVAAMI